MLREQTVRLVIVAGALAAVVSGCDRSGLHARRVDGAVSDARLSGGAGTDAGAAGDVPGEGRPACNRSTQTSTLAELDWPASSATLVLRGDSLFVSISQDGPGSPPVGEVVSVSTATGQATTYPVGEVIPFWLTAGSDSLFYIAGKAIPLAGGGSYRYDYSDVARLDLSTGKTSTVDSKLASSGFTIASLLSNSRGEVFLWFLGTDTSDSGSAFLRWDPTSQATTTIQKLEQVWGVVADDERLYWSGINGKGRMAFSSASTKGGAVTQLQEWSSDFFDPYVLRAVDAQSLYFIRPTSPTRGIFAVPKTGGDIRTVAANTDPVTFGNKNIDDTHVYWLDTSDQSVIKRTLKTGNGDIETIGGDEDDSITDVAVDACNVYWTTSMAPQILVRRK
jgi:hypothetical protein